MKICIAQTAPVRGNIAANSEAHKRFIDLALTLQAEAIFFPELSLTGFEPALARSLATTQNDPCLDIFQQLSDTHTLIIGVGLPTIADFQIRISMIIFEPHQPRKTYSKQHLHADELPYFEKGGEQVIIQTDDTMIAPAICYESLQPVHAESAYKLGAEVYLVSVAKPASGVEKAAMYFPGIAARYSMAVIMSNSVGPCDNFVSAGRSSAWTKEGKLVGQLGDQEEGIILFDTETEQVEVRILTNFPE